MSKSIWRSACLALVILGSGAASADESLHVFNDSKASFRGQFDEAQVRVEFDTQLHDDGWVVLHIQVDHQPLDVRFQKASDHIDVDGHGLALSDRQKAAFKDASEAIFDYVEESSEPYDLHTYLLVRLLAHWAELPQGVLLDRKEMLALR